MIWELLWGSIHGPPARSKLLFSYYQDIVFLFYSPQGHDTIFQEAALHAMTLFPWRDVCLCSKVPQFLFFKWYVLIEITDISRSSLGSAIICKSVWRQESENHWLPAGCACTWHIQYLAALSLRSWAPGPAQWVLHIVAHLFSPSSSLRKNWP